MLELDNLWLHWEVTVNSNVTVWGGIAQMDNKNNNTKIKSPCFCCRSMLIRYSYNGSLKVSVFKTSIQDLIKDITNS